MIGWRFDFKNMPKDGSKVIGLWGGNVVEVWWITTEPEMHYMGGGMLENVEYTLLSDADEEGYRKASISYWTCASHEASYHDGYGHHEPGSFAINPQRDLKAWSPINAPVSTLEGGVK